MTLKFMDGFETCADDSDLRARGYLVASTPQRMAFTTSISGLAGTSMRLIGAGSSSSGVPGAASTADPGYFNTGVTVNQAWNAGGFTMGWLGKFNSVSALSFGNCTTSSVVCGTPCFDGTNYWAIQFNSTAGVYSLVKSTDLKTWTAASSQPVGLGPFMSVQYVNGMLVVIGNGTSAASQSLYYSTNGALSWTTVALNTSGSSVTSNGVIVATGNSACPYVIGFSVQGAVNPGGYVIAGDITNPGSLVKVASWTTTANSVISSVRILGGLVCVLHTSSTGGNLLSASVSNASLNTTGAWTNATYTTAYLSDMAYLAASNQFVFTYSTGVCTLANTGASGTPVAPTGTLTFTARFTTVQCFKFQLIGSTLWVVGASGRIMSSTDGNTWTDSGGHIVPTGYAVSWRNLMYDGSRYVLFSDYATGVVATTPDMVTNYTATYCMEGVEVASSLGWGRVGVQGGTVPSGGLFSAYGGPALYITALSANTRNVQIYVGSNSTNSSAVYNVASAGTSPVHYYEFVATPVAGSPNTFLFTLSIDGTQVLYTTVGRLMAASTSDTTSVLYLTFDRYANMPAVDDVYFCLNDGSGISGPQGIINIAARRPSSDVSTQWQKTGSAASNAQSVRQQGVSSQSANYVSSQTAGDKDVYLSADAIPSGYTPKAVQVEGYFTCTSSTQPTVNIGLKNSSAEVDGGTLTVPLASSVMAFSVFEKDPSGAAWTGASVTATDIVANHVS